MARERGPGLLRQAAAARSAVLLDLAMDILTPPLSTLVVATAVGLMASVALRALGAPAAPTLAPWTLCALCLSAYLVRGWWLSGMGLRGLLDLTYAPFYIGWKIILALRSPKKPGDERVRTTRESKSH